jgi:hypothetical protein
MNDDEKFINPVFKDKIGFCSTPLNKNHFFDFLKEKRLSLSEEFKMQYMIDPSIGGEPIKNRCGDCTFFGDKGCTTSELEAKSGSRSTPERLKN